MPLKMPVESSFGRAMKGKTEDVFRSVINSRKSYKMLKGATEAVWPPQLEEALLKGFATYQPEDCRETRILGRFPMRNQFISDYIFRTVGKRRSAKQVGSRLQQLRDTYEGKELLNSLSEHYNLRGKPTAVLESSSGSSESVASSSSGSESGMRSTPLDTTTRRTIIQVDILPHGFSGSTIDPSDSSGGSAGGILSSDGITDVFRPSSQPRPIHSINPTITFISHSFISAQSTCTVLCNGVTAHHEVTPLVLSGFAPGDSDSCVEQPSLYSVQLVPEFWPLLCQDYDPARFTIIQEVTGPPLDDAPGDTLFSAVYHFNYPTESPPLSPLTPAAALTVPSSPIAPSPTSTLWDFDSVPSPMSDSWSFASENSAATSAHSYLYTDSSMYAPPPYASDGSLVADYSPVSPTSSCFPADLSNYLV